MRDLFFKLFEMSHFDTGITITPFSLPHNVYLVLIFGGIIGVVGSIYYFVGIRSFVMEHREAFADQV